MAADEAPHLLVVDDDERLRGLLRRYLSDNGFRITLAADAAEARLKLKSLDYDLAIVDVMMPGENGIALTASLKSERRVPILMLTAMAEAENRIHGLEQAPTITWQSPSSRASWCCASATFSRAPPAIAARQRLTSCASAGFAST